MISWRKKGGSNTRNIKLHFRHVKPAIGLFAHGVMSQCVFEMDLVFKGEGMLR